MRHFISLLFCFLFLGMTSIHAAMPIDSVRTVQEEGKTFVIHQVDQGETLYALSRRYSASVDEISNSNELINYSISLGQELRIPIKELKMAGMFHTVEAGETLYSISRAYEVSIEDLSNWNNLANNALAVGQKLSIGTKMKADPAAMVVEITTPVSNALDSEVVDSSENNTPEPTKPIVEDPIIEKPGFTYQVQAGETLTSIAQKFSVSTDSIQFWNNLTTKRLRIGQRIDFPFEVNMDSIALSQTADGYKPTKYGSKFNMSEDGGVKKMYEEGVARIIEADINSTKYLALHRTLTVGTVFQVKNVMNNKTIYVRVVGKLPNTGINDKVMVRLTPKAFEKLGIIDEKALVGITYFNE
ncbi:MAG: LysM repeat protein [Cyclobacteriaceae bacterium]|jgi:LysM repeat protein